MSFKDYEYKILELEKEKYNVTDEHHLSVIKKRIHDLKKEAYSNLNAWDRVYIARNQDRPKAQDYIHALFEDFLELHGDRNFRDDESIIGGLATFNGMPVTVIGQSKGKSLGENLRKNFGMVHPEGYRKVQRLALQAEKFNRPIITFVDTAGAYPGKGAEERGQAEAIASCLSLFSNIATPVICVVIGEGGSGGALALSVADRIVMLENAIYSILSPEGFASILWKDETRVKEAAEVMKLTSYDLKEKEIIDEIIKEPFGGAQECIELVIKDLRNYLTTTLNELKDKKMKTLLNERYAKFRKIGTF